MLAEGEPLGDIQCAADARFTHEMARTWIDLTPIEAALQIALETTGPGRCGQSPQVAYRLYTRANKLLLTGSAAATIPTALVRALGIADNNPEKLDKLAAALLAKAQEGEVAALREVADRLDGKVPQALQHSGEAQRPVAIISGVVRGTATSDVSPKDAD